MAWISLLFLFFNLDAAELPRLLTKHSPETLRYISLDGRYAYVQKRPGVLGLVTSFKSIDFLSEPFGNDFLVKSSPYKGRLIIESIPNAHTEMSLFKNHKILVVDYGNMITREIGLGKNAKLYLRDEWISYYNIVDKVIHIENLITQKKYEINLSKKQNPFFTPEVEMISSGTVVYTDINENGFAALVAYDLLSLKSTIIYKSSQSATRLELCRSEGLLALGEFPFDGVSRGSKIQTISVNDFMNLAGFTTVYSSVEKDIGNMVCHQGNIYFIKTVNHDEVLNVKVTEAVKLELKGLNVQLLSNLKHVTQLIEMDGRILIPLRGEFFVVEGQANLSIDTLKPNSEKEELEIDL
jgi:hypothetical protein